MPELWRNVLLYENKSQDDTHRISVPRPVISIYTDFMWLTIDI